MPTLRILTVDWDYFIDADSVYRAFNFPDCPNEKYPQDLQNIIWAQKYMDTKSKHCMLNIGLKESTEPFFKGLADLINRKEVPLYISDSHKYIYGLVKRHLIEGANVELVNVDEHHDCFTFIDNTGPVNCANWGRLLCSEYDRTRFKYQWVANEDSETQSIGGIDVAKELNFEYGFELPDPSTFDIVHICRSGMWSPPHLDCKFISYITSLMNADIYSMELYEEKALEDRFVDVLKQRDDLLKSYHGNNPLFKNISETT